MNILVRNEEHVSECILLNGKCDEPLEDIMERPQVKKFIAGRKVIAKSYSASPYTNPQLIIDLNLVNPR